MNKIIVTICVFLNFLNIMGSIYKYQFDTNETAIQMRKSLIAFCITMENVYILLLIDIYTSSNTNDKIKCWNIFDHSLESLSNICILSGSIHQAVTSTIDVIFY